MTQRAPLLALVLLTACDRQPSSPPPQPGTPVDTTAVAPPATPSPAPAADPSTIPILGWTATDLAELEVMIRGDRAIVVADDGSAARLLINCTADVAYSYVGGAPRKDHLVTGGSTFDAITIGTWTTTPPQRLQGDCGGATHVARAIDIGAFERASSSRTHNRGDVALPGGGVVGGSTTSTSSSSSKGGDLGSCVRGNRPTPGCSTPLVLHLDPLPR